jgi:hypothetical protein
VAEEKTEHQQAETTRGGRRLRSWAGIVLLAAAVVLGLFWIHDRWQIHAVEHKLAAIEAARAIPDEENAAVLYHQLLGRYPVGAPDNNSLRKATYTSAMSRPWAATDYPEMATWLQGRQGTISALTRLFEREKCRFSLSPHPAVRRRHRYLQHTCDRWTMMLILAANYDIGEGRLHAGIQKYLGILQMAKHFYQQQTLSDFEKAFTLESLLLLNLRRLVVKDAITQEHLRAIEQALPLPKKDWVCERRLIYDIEQLYENYELSEMGFLRRWARGFSNIVSNNDLRPAWRRFQDTYIRSVAFRRAARILISLRHYKSKYGHWPKTLKDVESLASPEVFVDPLNNGEFVYKQTQKGFTLYSKGKNNIDEDGQITLIPSATGWPKLQKDDVLIWPPRDRLGQTDEQHVEEGRS